MNRPCRNAPRRQVRRRVIDWDETLQRFERRVRRLPEAVFSSAILGLSCSDDDVHGGGDDEMLPVYLTTYDVWNTITHSDDARVLENDGTRSNALVLLRLALERSIPIAGIATERRINGRLVDAPGEPHRRVYVGRYNTFASPPLASHSLLSIKSGDKAYVVDAHDGNIDEP